jgi:hypothetical protein
MATEKQVSRALRWDTPASLYDIAMIAGVFKECVNIISFGRFENGRCMDASLDSQPTPILEQVQNCLQKLEVFPKVNWSPADPC